MSSSSTRRILIVGAGIIGCSAAYQLKKAAEENGLSLEISIVDEREPGSLTSSASTECYRNWWTESTMLQFVGHSIDLYEKMDEASFGAFRMNRPGYVFFTADSANIARYKAESELCERLGAGAARFHSTGDLSGYETSSGIEPRKNIKGIDVLVAGEGAPYFSQPNWPVVKPGFVVAKHVRNCGWIDVQKYLDWMNQESRAAGVTFLRDSVKSASLDEREPGSPGKVLVTFANTQPAQQTFDHVVLALGPKIADWLERSTAETSVPRLLGRPLAPFKLILEIHAKVIFRDPLGIVPRGAPLCLFDDAVTLEWTDQQRAWIASQPHLKYLLEPFKGGVHFRPLGDGDECYGIWTYNLDVEEGFGAVPAQPHIDEYYGEIVLRGLSHFVPGLKAYVGTAENPLSSANSYIKAVKAGYYCKTPENRPFIGPAWEDDSRIQLLSCFSGFGIMTAPAAAEFIASYLTNVVTSSTNTRSIAPYATDFLPSRYTNEEYLEKVRQLAGNSGQL